MRQRPLAEELVREFEETYQGDVGRLAGVRKVENMLVGVVFAVLILLVGFLAGFWFGK